MSEAQKEAERRYPSSPARSFTEGQTVQARRNAFIAGAEWQASSPVTDAQVDAAKAVGVTAAPIVIVSDHSSEHVWGGFDTDQLETVIGGEKR